MEGDKEPTLDAKEIAERWTEFQSKKWAFIDNNWVR